MQDNIQTIVKEIVKIANHYAKNKESHLEEIEVSIQKLFEAQTVKFWSVDTSKEILSILGSDAEEVLALDSSITKQAIESKKVLLENHVTSDKYYNAPIDNPFGLKIKALMVFPIVKEKRVVGVLKIWRGIKQRKVFSKKDEELLLSLSLLWLRIFEGREVEKEILLELLGEKVEHSAKSRGIKKEQAEEMVIKNVKQPHKEHIEFEALKKEYNILLEEKKRYIEDASVFQRKMDAYDKELEASMIKYKELENSSLELYSESQLNQTMIKELEKELKLLNKENKELKSDLKDKEKSCKSIKELKSEKSLLQQKNSSILSNNIEEVLLEIDQRFGENEYAYMLFELMLYALHSKKGMVFIEESIKKSKLVQQLTDGYYFKGDLQVHNEKYLIADMVKHIQNYENNIFSSMIDIKIKVDELMPASLVFDAAKIQSIILHLLIDLHQFVDHSKAVNVDFTFKKKFLQIEIGGSIHKKNSLFQSMFKQTKLGGDEKDRIGLKLSKKVITRLKGEIDYRYEDNYYTFIMTVPTQVIKM